MTELVDAYHDRDLTRMESLLDNGANPRENDDHIFDLVVREGDFDALELLLQYTGNDPLINNQQLIRGANLYGHSNMIDFFLLLGARPENHLRTIHYETIQKIANTRTQNTTTETNYTQ